MEIRNISQGRQTNFDETSQNASSTSSGQVGEVQVQESKESGTKLTPNGEQKVDEKEVKGAIDKLNKFLEDNKTHAEYEIHDEFKDVMIKVVDDNTGKVVLEVPPKKILDMVASMMKMVGLLVDKKA